MVIARKIGEKRCTVVASRKLDMVEKMAKKKDHPNVVTLLFSGSDGEKSQWKIVERVSPVGLRIGWWIDYLNACCLFVC